MELNEFNPLPFAARGIKGREISFIPQAKTGFCYVEVRQVFVLFGDKLPQMPN